VSSGPKYRRVFANNLRLYRKLSGLTQEKLAEKADVHPVYISALERGVENVSLDTLYRIARALNVTVVDLCQGF